MQGGDSLEAYYNIDNNGKTRKQLKLLRTVTASGDELTRQAQAMLDHKMRGDYEPLAVKQLFYKTLLEFVEVEATRQGITTSELKYRAVDLSGFVDWVNENRRILRGAIKLPSRAKLRLSVVQYVNSWLLNIGIKPARVKMPGNTWAHCIKKNQHKPN
ncbi:Uncharacterised protein [Candidatus Venteria ishoeyi]|uniref:Uncharacterized protein n=1 Tax=Candidatus Venteria ishoeyi TaxID=1899563 RepID=A0A1H6F9U4_9GAMM|nr:Uncharacterised protein [Candidatus Venteria ishoeyi]